MLGLNPSIASMLATLTPLYAKLTLAHTSCLLVLAGLSTPRVVQWLDWVVRQIVAAPSTLSVALCRV